MLCLINLVARDDLMDPDRCDVIKKAVMDECKRCKTFISGYTD